MVFRNPALESWILFSLITKKVTWIDVDYIVDVAPKSLIKQVPSTQELLELLFHMEMNLGLLTHNFKRFRITTEGKLQFRKNLDPLNEIVKNEKRLNQIIDETEGDYETKKQYKKLLKKIKDYPKDEFDDEVIDFLKNAGKETMFYTIRVLFEFAK